MKDKKKLIIIIAIVILVIAGIIVAVIFIPKKNKPTDKTTTTTTAAIADEITIKFDTQDGEKIEDMKVKKGEKVTLPASKKEGYTFDKWVDNKNTEYTEEATFENDVTLTAKYTEIKADAKIVKVTYDSKGGSKVSATTYECKDDSITIKLPKAPTKDGYNFVSWADKNGKVILTGAKLTCENITLYANWEEKKTEEVKKTYTCADGYELKDTNKCVQTTKADETCPLGWTLVKGDCVNPNSKNPNGTRTCKKESVPGYGTAEGTYHQAQGGPATCLYVEIPSAKGQQEKCTSAQVGGVWYSGNSGCYKMTKINNYTTECASGEKKFGNQEIAPGNGGGCYQVTSPIKKCPDGYNKDTAYGECAKVVNATEQ